MEMKRINWDNAWYYINSYPIMSGKMALVYLKGKYCWIIKRLQAFSNALKKYKDFENEGK